MERILQIGKYYKPYIGGIEQTTFDISESLKCISGVNQMVFCFNDGKKSIEEIVDGVIVHRVGVIKKVASQPISLSYKKELKKVLEEFKPTKIIFHYPNPFAARYLLKLIKKKDIKIITWYHADIVKQKILKLFFEKQTRKLLKISDKVIATSPLYVDGSKYLKSIKKKVEIIPSCINEKRLVVSDKHTKMANEIRESNKDKKIVFAIGRHVSYKGLKYLIAANKYLSDDIKIFIAGTGPLTNDLKKQASKYSNIEFIGRLSDDDYIAYLIASDIYAFPSITKNEAFGLTLVEAMYFRKPAVTFTIPGSGVNYVNLNEVTGLEVENSNEKKYADAILKLISNPELMQHYGNAGRSRVLNNFMLEQFKRNLYNILINEVI